jgi:hypothetical protein
MIQRLTGNHNKWLGQRFMPIAGATLEENRYELYRFFILRTPSKQKWQYFPLRYLFDSIAS